MNPNKPGSPDMSGLETGLEMKDLPPAIKKMVEGDLNAVMKGTKDEVEMDMPGSIG